MGFSENIDSTLGEGDAWYSRALAALATTSEVEGFNRRQLRRLNVGGTSGRDHCGPVPLRVLAAKIVIVLKKLKKS